MPSYGISYRLNDKIYPVLICNVTFSMKLNVKIVYKILFINLNFVFPQLLEAPQTPLMPGMTPGADLSALQLQDPSLGTPAHIPQMPPTPSELLPPGKFGAQN